MKIVPLAADSLGVRSMATYVECGQTRVLIDPGASLGESRFNLPPADEEWEALRRANDRISAYAAGADLVFVSHYHEDHFRYDPTIYLDKNVWAKDPKRMVGARQAGRAAVLWKGLQGRCRLDAAEGRRLETPDLVLTDYQLRSGETGITLVRRLVARHPGVPAVLITGDTAPDRLREAAESALPLLHKPVSAEALRALIAAMTQRKTPALAASGDAAR